MSFLRQSTNIFFMGFPAIVATSSLACRVDLRALGDVAEQTGGDVDPSETTSNSSSAGSGDPDVGSESESGSHDADASEPSECTQVALEELLRLQPSGYYTSPNWQPSLGDRAVPDELRLFFRDFGQFVPGVQELATGVNGNLATCWQCLLIRQDVGANGVARRTFFPAAGTITIADDDSLPAGGVKVELVGVRFYEVSVEGGSSAFVPGGECLDIIDGTLATPSVPEGWDCNEAHYFDGSCDCGCGATDLDCSMNDMVLCL